MSPGQCEYARHPPRGSGNDERSHQHLPTSPLSSHGSHTSSANAALAERVQKLEQLLQVSDRSSFAGPTARTLQEPNNSVGSSSWSPPIEQRSGRRNLGGILRTTDTGHVRFIPKPRNSSTPDDDFLHLDCAESPFPINQNDTTTLQALLARLPPQSRCSELVDVYVHSFASLFHILHDPTFAQQYVWFLEDASSVSLSWLALLFAVLGVAVLALESGSSILQDLSRGLNGYQKIVELSERYWSAAMACLEADRYMWNHNVNTLQTLILLIYGIGHSHGQSWTLLGLAHHLAISIGCHVDPSEFGLDVVRCEERRRCWSGLMMLYTTQNTAMGNVALPHGLLQASTQPPADIDDCELNIDTMELPLSPQHATQMSYLRYKFRLYDICSMLCDKVLNVDSVSFEVVSEIDGDIVREQQSWNSRYHNSNVPVQLPVHHQAHLEILQSYAYHLILLLHHPTATGDAYSPSICEWSQSRLFLAAMGLLKIHDDFHESHDFTPFKWYNRGVGSFHAFHAAVVLFGLRNSVYARGRSAEITQALRRCADRFQQMSTLSPLCLKAAPVLRRLLTRLPLEPFSPTGNDAMQAREQPKDDTATGHVSSAEPTLANDYIDLDSIFDQFQPQDWLTPSSLPWHQLESPLINYAPMIAS